MYRLGHQIRHHHWPYIVIGLLLVSIMATAGFRQLLRPTNVVVESRPITHYVATSTVATQHISKTTFTIDLPAGWHQVANNTTAYSWQGTIASDADRHLDVYIDQLPATFVINHLLPVQSNGDHLDMIGTVSDNCVNFTDKSNASPNGAVTAKWEGIIFLCDTGNYERDVVGIGDAEGINDVTVVGPATGKHRIMLAYTDNNINPDYTLFTTMIKSFRVL